MSIKNSHHYLNLAKNAVEAFIKNGEIIKPPKNLPPEIVKKQAGVFVSLHQKNGKLRGCIGTFLPTQKNVAREIIRNAVAATDDPRFPPLSIDELESLKYKVDVLSDLENAQKKDLNPKKYGLLITGPDNRRGLLLPDLPGIKSAENQIKYCRLKAGIEPKEPVKYQIFTVTRHEE